VAEKNVAWNCLQSHEHRTEHGGSILSKPGYPKMGFLKVERDQTKCVSSSGEMS
jgi:hypothetical protein